MTQSERLRQNFKLVDVKNYICDMFPLAGVKKQFETIVLIF